MALSDQALRNRARRTYEFGRLRAQLWLFVPAMALAGIALHFNRPAAATAWVGGTLLIAMVGLRWRGGAWAGGVLPGLAGGSLAFLLPIAACSSGFCSVTLTSRLLMICTIGGGLAGALLTLRSLRGRGCSLPCLLSGALVSALAASLSCSVAGVAGISAMLAGLSVAAGPGFLVARQV